MTTEDSPAPLTQSQSPDAGFLDGPLEAVVGANWESHYKDVFARFRSRSRPGPKLSWPTGWNATAEHASLHKPALSSSARRHPLRKVRSKENRSAANKIDSHHSEGPRQNFESHVSSHTAPSAMRSGADPDRIVSEMKRLSQ